MWTAAFWGLVGGIALVAGAAVTLIWRVPSRVVGWITAFGAGVLISALSIDLAQDAFATGGWTALAAGLAAGALSFYVGDLVLDKTLGRPRKQGRDWPGPQQDNSANAIVLGSLLDGIPESVAIGVSLLSGEGVGLAVVIAVFLSNVPESLSASDGLRAAGHRPRWILGLWTGIALASALSAGLGYAFLGDAPPVAVAAVQAFAAGAVLTMLADTMMPEAYTRSRNVAGLLTTLGFAVAFLVSRL